MGLFSSKAILSSHPVDIYARIDEVYADEEWLGWEPDVLLMTVCDERTEDALPEALDKVLAVQSAAGHSNLVLENAVAFEKVVNSFCNNPCVPDTAQPPEIEELAYAVKQLVALIQETHEVAENAIIFSGEIPGYVAAVAKYRSWVVLPRPLAFAQAFLNSLLGLVEGSDKWEQNRALLTAARELAENLTDGDLSPEDLAALDGGPVASVVTRLIGALLFDPTSVE